MDMTKGIIARFKTMRIWRPSVLAGHVFGNLVLTAVSVAVVIAVALVIGYRPTAGPLEWLAVVGLLLLVAVALTWLSVALGLLAKSVETASNMPMFLFLLPFLGSGFVPTDSMPAGLRWFADNQPFTPITDTLRSLLGGEHVGGRRWRQSRGASRSPPPASSGRATSITAARLADQIGQSGRGRDHRLGAKHQHFTPSRLQRPGDVGRLKAIRARRACGQHEPFVALSLDQVRERMPSRSPALDPRIDRDPSPRGTLLDEFEQGKGRLTLDAKRRLDRRGQRDHGQVGGYQGRVPGAGEAKGGVESALREHGTDEREEDAPTLVDVRRSAHSCDSPSRERSATMRMSTPGALPSSRSGNDSRNPPGPCAAAAGRSGCR